MADLVTSGNASIAGLRDQIFGTFFNVTRSTIGSLTSCQQNAVLLFPKVVYRRQARARLGGDFRGQQWVPASDAFDVVVSRETWYRPEYKDDQEQYSYNYVAILSYQARQLAKLAARGKHKASAVRAPNTLLDATASEDTNVKLSVFSVNLNGRTTGAAVESIAMG